MLQFVNELLSNFWSTGKDWLKSHTVMAVIVFILLLIGLSVINYGIVDFGNFAGIFFIALGLAILDFLPIIGILVPMGIWASVAILALGNNTLGLAVIVLCLLVLVIKQIIEPFIAGKSLGISPLEEIASALVACFVLGLNPLGLIFGPIIYTVGKGFYLKYKNR